MRQNRRLTPAGRRFDWKSVTIRHDKSDVERRDDGSVDAAVVDGFLRAVADGRIETNGLEDLPIRVMITPRVGDTLIELRLRGNEPDYAAILTSTGRPKPL